MISRNRVYNGILFGLSALYIALPSIGGNMTGGYGQESLIVCLAVMAVVYLLKTRMKIYLHKPTWFHVWMCAIAFFCLISILWSMSQEKAWDITFYVSKVMAATFLVFICLPRDLSIDTYLKIIMFGGYLIALYVMLFFGLDHLTELFTKSERISNDATNANGLGIWTSFALIINMYFWLYHKRRWWSIFMIPGFFMVIVSESRTALVQLAFGIALLILFKNMSSGHKADKVLKIVVSFVVLLIVGITLIQLPFFDGIMRRFTHLVHAASGTGETETRIKMMRFGLKVFSEHPFLGLGMNNARVAFGQAYGREGFLHCNYIELLADGGIVGFAVYYSMMAWILYQYYQHRDFRQGEFNICLALLLVRLLIDIGGVFYYDSPSYFFLMVLFLNIQRMREAKSVKCAE